MEHTPGLWKIENNGELQELDGVQYVRIMGPGEYEHICDVFETPALPSYPNVKVDARANARLIAAAPDLLAMCKLAANYVAKMVVDNVNTVVPPIIALNRIEAAIAKAEGKEV